MSDEDPSLDDVRHLVLHRLEVGRVLEVLGTDPAHPGPVVGHALGGRHKRVVDELARVVDYAHARQDAVLSV